MTEKLVSIITPCYNGAKFISQTIDSVLAQTYTNWELIIVNDGSVDESSTIIKEYIEKDPRITCIEQSNSGSAESRNMAIKLSSGDYLAFLDADDIWHIDYLEKMIGFIESNSSDDIAIHFSGYRRMNYDCSRPKLNDFSCPGIRTFSKLLLHCPIFPSATIIERKKIKNIVLFRKELHNLRADYVFWLDIMKQNLKCQGYPDVLVDYRMRDDSLTSSKIRMIKPQWNVYRKILGLPVWKSLYYICRWGINGVIKYRKI